MYKEMACEQFKKLLVLYHYGELGPNEAADVAAHIKSCPVCERELRETGEFLSTFPVYVPSQFETARAVKSVMAGISGPTSRSWVKRLLPAYIAAAAAAAAVILSINIPKLIDKAPQENQHVMAQGDWEVVENYDVIKDYDVIDQMDDIDTMEQL